MTLATFKILAAFVIFATSIVAGILPIRASLGKKAATTLPTMEGFASGIFMGTAVFHMLPIAFGHFQSISEPDAYSYTLLFSVFGFSLLFFLEKLVKRFPHPDELKNKRIMVLVLTLFLSVHAVLAGAALGINTTLTTTFVLFVAIIAHKGSESFALAANLHRGSMTLSQMVVIFFIFSLMTPAGILLGSNMVAKLQSAQGQWMEASFNAVAAGTFMYIATLHRVLHRCIHDEENRAHMRVALISGLLISAVIAIWL